MESQSAETVPVSSPSPAHASLTPGVLWTLQGLVLAGLAIASFLLYVHVASNLAQARTKVPLCGFLSWMDCDTVLNNPRYSVLMGIPVAGLAAGTYLVLGVLLASLRAAGLDPTVRRNIWWGLHAGAMVVAAAAVWFIYVQLAVIQKICTWCLAEHLVGLTLALLIWLHGDRLRVLPGLGRGSAAAAGILLGLLLAVGQRVQTPAYVQPVLMGKVNEAGNYEEPASGQEAVRIFNKQVTLNRRAHPLLGMPQARYVIVEAIDYTCPRCKNLSDLLREAEPLLGPDYAVMVLTFPLSHHCNVLFKEESHERHRYACDLSRLAQAVWLTDPTKFGRYHAWLFENQKEISQDTATAWAMAEQLVGASGLARAYEDQAQKLLHRDLDMIGRMGLKQLPGLFVGDVSFSAIPLDPDELVRHIRMAFEGPPQAPAEPVVE